MAMVKGVVSKVNGKPSGNRGGYRVGLCIDNVWYNMFQRSDTSGQYANRLVAFDFSEDQYGKQIDAKTIKVAEAPANAVPVAPKGRPAYSGDANTGIKVGHAINNAVVIATAEAKGKAVAIGRVRDIAESILGLSVIIEHEYPSIISKAKQNLAQQAVVDEGDKEADEKEQDDGGFNDDVPF